MSVIHYGWSSAHFLRIHDSGSSVAFNIFLASGITLLGSIKLSLVVGFHEFFQAKTLAGNDLSRFLIKVNLELFISLKIFVTNGGCSM